MAYIKSDAIDSPLTGEVCSLITFASQIQTAVASIAWTNGTNSHTQSTVYLTKTGNTVNVTAPGIVSWTSAASPA
jgi:hypothetical protein